LDTLDEPWFVIVAPACIIATGAVFGDPRLTRNSQPVTIDDFVAGKVRNDCEAVVYRRYPAVAAAAHWLGAYGQARLTGTGACVFAAFAERPAAEAVLARLPPSLPGFMARGLNRSPLWERLQRELHGARV
jgi:4-diphosphocytidyl-2-C-methyl-D-erythritol kinase